jgi:biopolymer transport protein ExbB/TolQ
VSLVTNAIYWIATGLLVPVILGLLVLLGWALLQLGDLFGAFVDRRRRSATLREWNRLLLEEPVRSALADVPPGRADSLSATLRRCIAVDWHPIHAAKILADHELAARKALDAPTLLIRTGPMMGLMGTLIHVGPAIRGLAAGDLAAMAGDIEVVFTITVLGIFVGAIGFWVKTVRQRWAQADALFLHYAFDLAQSQSADHRHHLPVSTTNGEHHHADLHDARRTGA